MSNQSITIGSTAIKVNNSGLYCLNDLHKAAGGEAKHTPGRFTKSEWASSLVDELSQNRDIEVLTSKSKVGTYACKELVYSYAMWISPAFSIRVIQAFDALASGDEKKALAMAGTQAASDRLALLDDDLVKEYITIRKRELRQIESKADQLRKSLADMDVNAPDVTGDQVEQVINLLGRRKKAGRNWITIAELKDGVKNLLIFSGQRGLSTYLAQVIMPDVIHSGVATVDGKRINIK